MPLLLAAIAVGAPSAAAAVTRCLGPEGRTLHTNVVCPEGYAPAGETSPASSPGPTPSSPSTASPGDRPFLWSVSGGRNTVRLLGSLHLAPSDLYPLRKEVEEAYHRSPVVVLELDPAAADEPAYEVKLLAEGMYRDGTTVGQHLSPPARELLWRRVAEAGLPRAQIDRLKPWLCTLVVTEATLRRAGIEPEAGLDRHFLSRSRADGKQTLFLETPAFQLGLLAGLEESLQESFLLKVLGDLDQVQGLYGQVVGLWRSGDAGGLAALLEPGAQRFPRIHERFVIERNRRWLQRLREFLALPEDVLLLVGAAHLAGPDGLLALLRAEGYAVEQR